MCAIAGAWHYCGGDHRVAVARMVEVLRHRGPDGTGIWGSTRDGVWLGHCRLAVIDLTDAGRQPMTNGASGVVISFNGEIYNYAEIRRELIAKGVQFKSNSDTEVILEAYRHWGHAFVERLTGMFAIAIWDPALHELLLVRDRFGVKPLYYRPQATGVVFASELKGILAHGPATSSLNNQALADYFTYGYVEPSRSIHDGVVQVPPGCYVRIKSASDQVMVKYWSTAVTSDTSTSSFDEASEQLWDLLTRSLKYRLVSDVPVGLFLSGGIDSALIATIASRANAAISAFTVAFDGGKDESPWAIRIADKLGMPIQRLVCSTSEALGLVPQLPQIYDEPFADSSAIPTVLICRAAAAHVKVALSGDGGDELFCGYDSYPKISKAWRLMSRVPRSMRRVAAHLLSTLSEDRAESLLRKFAILYPDRINLADAKDKAQKLPDLLRTHDFPEAYQRFASLWSPLAMTNLTQGLEAPRPLCFSNGAVSREPSDYMMSSDFRLLLPGGLLTKVDRASMSTGLEVREPLLDHTLAEFAVRLPLAFKYKDSRTKFILKHLLLRHLPSDLIDRPKVGFSVPLRQWLNGPLRTMAIDALDPDTVRRQGVLNCDTVRLAREAVIRRSAFDPRRIWSLVIFQLWVAHWANVRSQSS